MTRLNLDEGDKTKMSEGASIWPTLLAAGLPALAAVVAAVVAALAARSARRHEIDAQKMRDLEARIAKDKSRMYEPMIELFREVFDERVSGKPVTPGKIQAQASKFLAWVAIYGSDEAVRGFSHFMQATFYDAPAPILLRLYADFVIAARRDLGHPDTDLTREGVMAMRIKDLYHDDEPLLQTLRLPLDEVALANGWEIPWPLEKPDWNWSRWPWTHPE